MMKGVNKVILIGYVGNYPTLRYNSNGVASTTLDIATHSSVLVDANNNQWEDQVSWHRVVFFTRLAEIVGKYVTKGACIFVEGRLQTSEWTTDNGEKRWSTQVIAKQMQILSSKQESPSTEWPVSMENGTDTH